MAKHDDSIEVPITVGFDQNRVIGFAKLKKSELPTIPNYHFALSVIIKEMDTKNRQILDCDIIELSLVNDENFTPLSKMI